MQVVDLLVRLAGVEPATLGLEVRCSIQLSYRRVRHLRYTERRAGGSGLVTGQFWGSLRHQPLDSLVEAIWCEVGVPLDHGQRLPTSHFLYRQKVRKNIVDSRERAL